MQGAHHGGETRPLNPEAEAVMGIPGAQAVPGTAVFAGLAFLSEPCLYHLSCEKLLESGPPSRSSGLLLLRTELARRGGSAMLPELIQM